MDQTILFPTNIPAHVQLSDALRNEINQAQKMDYNSEEHAILPFADAIGNFGADLINYEFLGTHMQDIFHVIHPADPAIAAAEQAAREAEQQAATQRLMHRRLREQENQHHAQNIAPTHRRRQHRRNNIGRYLNEQREIIKRAEEMARMGATIQKIEESFTTEFAQALAASKSTNHLPAPTFMFVPDAPPEDLRTITHEGVTIFGKPDRGTTEYDSVQPGRVIFCLQAAHATLPYYHTEIISPDNYRQSIIAFIRPTPRGWAIIPVIAQQYERNITSLIQSQSDNIGPRLRESIKYICQSLLMHEYTPTTPWSDEEFANLCAQYTDEITKAIKEKDSKRHTGELSSRENHIRDSMEYIQRMQHNIDVNAYDIQQSKNQLLDRHHKMQQLLQCLRTDKHITYAFIQNERYEGRRCTTIHLHMNPETFPESPHILLRISQYNDQQCNAHIEINGLADDHPLAQKYLPITVLEQCNQALKEQKITQFLRNLRRIINNPERI